MVRIHCVGGHEWEELIERETVRGPLGHLERASLWALTRLVLGAIGQRVPSCPTPSALRIWLPLIQIVSDLWILTTLCTFPVSNGHGGESEGE
jgi:hypothetical protein